MNTKDITPDPRQLRVDISMAEDLVCENCNNLTFEPVMMFKKLSALMSPTGKATLVPIDTFSCVASGWVNTMFRPNTGKKEEPNTESEDSAQNETDSKPKIILGP